MVDTLASGASGGNPVEVQVLSSHHRKPRFRRYPGGRNAGTVKSSPRHHLKPRFRRYPGGRNAGPSSPLLGTTSTLIFGAIAYTLACALFWSSMRRCNFTKLQNDPYPSTSGGEKIRHSSHIGTKVFPPDVMTRIRNMTGLKIAVF